MEVFCKMAVFALLIFLCTVLVTVDCAVNSLSGNYQKNDRTYSKRLLLDDDYHTIINRLNNLTNQVGSLKNEDDALKNEVGSLKNEVGALKNEVEALKKENSFLRNQTVAFLAEKTSSLTGQNHHIYYDNIKLNIGNAFHLAHGNFIAPVNGLYQFSVTACSNNPHFIVLELMVNAAIVGKLIAGDGDLAECTSNSFLVQLSVADDVYVQHEALGDYLYSDPRYGYPSFAGVLLNAF